MKDKVDKNICNKSISLLDCIEAEKVKFSFEEFSDINLIRIKDSNYIIKNNSEIKINYIFPFINDNNWFIDEVSLTFKIIFLFQPKLNLIQV